MDIQDPTLSPTAATADWRAMKTSMGATVSSQRSDAGPIRRRFCASVSGKQEQTRFCGSFQVRGSASGQTEQPVQSRLAWAIGGYIRAAPNNAIRNAFGWGMGLDEDEWAARGAVTTAAPVASRPARG